MHVVAVVGVGGRSGALDPLTPVVGVPMVVRSVRCLLASGLLARVLLLGAGDRREAFARACVDLPVEVHDGSLRQALSTVGAHAGQRAEPATGDGVGAGALLVHDAARALAPSGLVHDVLAAIASGHRCAVPVLPLSDTVKVVDSEGLVRGSPDRASLRVVQSPRAFRIDPPTVSDLPADPLAVGRDTAAHTIPGHPLAFAITGPWDLELAELLVRGGET